MKTRLLLAVLVLAIVAGVVWRLETRGAGEDKKHGDRALTVKTVPVEVRDFPRALDLAATLEAARQVALVPQVGGVLVRQLAHEGDAVRAGQVLFELDARPAAARVGQAAAALTGAEAEISEAQKKLARLQPLVAPGYISRQELDDAQLALEGARSRAATARAERDAARLDVGYATVRAPIAGRLGRVTVQVGTLIAAGGAPLATVIADGGWVARASVAARDWPAFDAARRAGPVAGELRDLEGHTLARGALAFVDNRIDPASGAVAIKLALDGAPTGLLDGQTLALRLLLGADAGARVVPEAAVQIGQGGAYVYVVRGGRALVQTVEARRTLDGETWIAGEVKPGEAVLVEVPQRLKAGDKVKLAGADKRKAGRQGGETGLPGVGAARPAAP